MQFTKLAMFLLSPSRLLMKLEVLIHFLQKGQMLTAPILRTDRPFRDSGGNPTGILKLAISIIARYACFRDSVCCVTLYSHGHERR